MEAMKIGRAGIIKSTLDDGKIKSSPTSGCDIPSTMPECRNFTVGFVTGTLDLAGESKVLTMIPRYLTVCTGTICSPLHLGTLSKLCKDVLTKDIKLQNIERINPRM